MRSIFFPGKSMRSIGTINGSPATTPCQGHQLRILTTVFPIKGNVVEVLNIDDVEKAIEKNRWCYFVSDFLTLCLNSFAMVNEAKVCRKCGSEHIVKNGSNGSGNPKYKCKNCGFAGVFQTVRKSEAFKDMVVRASLERCSARGLGRVFGVSYQTVLRWIKKSAVSPRHKADASSGKKVGHLRVG